MPTNQRPAIQFKIATEEREFEWIHQLNYRTFVEEIPQHSPSPERRLVDKFHSENTYLIGLCAGQLAGMVAVRARRPFSLDLKLPNLDTYLPAGHAICEVRLLAVERNHRHRFVFQGLVENAWRHAVEKGYTMAIVSGTTRQLKLYRHLGFVPFGPLVGKGEAMFQPMYLATETFAERVRAGELSLTRHWRGAGAESPTA